MIKSPHLNLEKLFFLPALLILSLFTACGDDDSDGGGDTNPSFDDIVINEVQYLGTDRVELTNAGSTAIDVSSLWLCTGPGNYSEISTLTATGSLTISAGGFLILEGFTLPDDSGGLGLYLNDSNFGSADNIIDFVQYGASDSPRESVAVSAGIWTDGEFVALVSAGSSIEYDGSGNSASDWIEQPTPTFGAANTLTGPGPDEPDFENIVINEVQYLDTDKVELTNTGTTAIDVSELWLCTGPGNYSEISTLTATGALNIEAGGFLVLEGFNLPDSDGGLALYLNNNDFSSADNILDFIQYGASDSPRENVAVSAGIWTDGEFVALVSSGSSIEYDGTGNSATDWVEQPTPTFGAANTLTGPGDPVVGNIAINEVEYFGTDRIELINNGSEAFDVSDYWLCTGPGTYVQLGTLTPISGTLNIPAGGLLVVGYDMPDAAAGLGLYINNNDFGSADNLLDFVQYGAGGSTRENVAVAAGIWTAGEFVPTVFKTGYSIEFDGEGNSPSDWFEQPSPTFGEANSLELPTPALGDVALNEIEYFGTDRVEILNTGDLTYDLSTLWLCAGPGFYLELGNTTPLSGSLKLNPGELVVISFNMPDSDAGVGIYLNSSFGSSASIIDFVQYGAAGSARESVAVSAGIWTNGEFVPNVAAQGNAIAYDGAGDAVSDWVETASPTFGDPNPQ